MLKSWVASFCLASAAGLLLAACGGTMEGVGGEPTDEPLGTVEGGLCSGLSVTSLTITDASSYGGELGAVGTWSVSQFSNAVRLEYRVNGTLRAFEERPGNSGAWYHSNNGMGCGTHQFEVRAYPMVIDSNGNRTTCMSGSRAQTQSVVQSCPSASLSCWRSSSYWITCGGSSGGGAGSPTPFWRQSGTAADGTWVDTGWSQGGWSRDYFCAQSYVFYPTDQFQVEFKVRDISGMESSAAFSENFLCEPGALM